ncbi:MAG: 16S rRNA (guanine(527)-N(7))-methyltransferase RsmG [bacterium]
MYGDQVERYLSLLKEYNEHTNIYSKKAYDKLDFHVKDSCVLAGLIGNKSCRVLDIGSGSGFPSVIIAICNPKNKVRAVESKSRKTRFLEQVKIDLCLDNFEVVQANIVEYGRCDVPKADVITAKAFASLERVKHVSKPLRKARHCIWIPIHYDQFDEIEDTKTCRIEKDGFYYLKREG